MEVLELTELLQLFNKALEIEALEKEPKGLYSPIRYAMSMGGKRLRPILTMLCSQTFGANPEKAIPAAMAIEFFHNSTLVHDDIMDKSPLRRNQTTVYKKWNTNTAILSGDAMIILAYQYLARLDSKSLAEVMPVFNKIALQVCEGQQYDMDFENTMDVTVGDYIEMVRLKTSVLLAGSAQIGAILGGATQGQQKLIYSFGENLGIAFQLQDDYLDVFGTKDDFGKKIGGDIVAKKKTFLLIKALELARGEYLEQLIGLINSKTISADEKVEKVTAIYRILEIDKRTEEAIHKYFDLAYDSLNKLANEGINTALLSEYANKLSNRKN
ncbi:MAG TPA: polyprenyl synthetase family protein [Salinivirgaceae bacterium]|nr:polyprenyl synthetase family protein [Salinivirgaceae bacterium]